MINKQTLKIKEKKKIVPQVEKNGGEEEAM